MKLVQTALIKATLAKHKQQNEGPTSKQAGDGWVDHKFIVKCCKDLDLRLAKILKGTSVYVPPPPPKPAKSKEFEEFMQRLRTEAQEAEYRSLAGIKDEQAPMFSGSDAKQVKEELTTILNFAISFFAVGFALWYWAKWWDPASRTLLALFGAIVALVAEVVLYSSYRSKVDTARKIERAKTDSGEVVEVIEPKQPEPLAAKAKATATVQKGRSKDKKAPRARASHPAKAQAKAQASGAASEHPASLRSRAIIS